MSDTVQEKVWKHAALVAVDGSSYPLEFARIVARAEGGIALSTLTQRYANPHDEALEVEYTLPLPPEGAVIAYTIRMGRRVIQGEVQPREKASEAYREALAEGRTAGLLEQSRPDTFRQKLGNVPAKTAVEITIDVLHPLAFLTPGIRSGAEAPPARPQWEYRFPTVVGVRYHGAPGRVPDARDVSPDRGRSADIPTRVELELAIADATGSAAPTSPSHALETKGGEGRWDVRFREGERLDRDIVVRWEAATGDVGVRIVEGGGLEGDAGRYALVTVVPPAVPARTYRRDVTVLLDASGSMDGEPLELGKRVVGELLRSLDAEDRFELIAFASNVKRLTPTFVSADAKGLERGLRALKGVRAGGGTEMLSGIEEAMKSSRDDAQRQVVLVTDGQIGFESEVVTRIADEANVRLHAVGVGHAPNRSLTQQAAFAGRGIELNVTSAADADSAGPRLVAATAAPVLTGLSGRGTAVTGEQVSRLRDVFAGQPLLFTAELSPSGGTLEIRGSLAGEDWTHRIDVPALGAPGAGLPATTLPLGALHGRALVAEYELAGWRGWSAEPDGHRIESCAMRHRITSSATSLVAIAEEPSVNPDAPRRRERLAVELPAGVSAEGVGLAGLAMYDRWAFMTGAGSLVMGPPLMVSKPRAEHLLAAAHCLIGRSDPLMRSLEPTRVRWDGHDRLVVEFEAPEDGFQLTAEDVVVVFKPITHTRKLRVRPDDEESTALRPAARGTLVKLVLHMPESLRGAKVLGAEIGARGHSDRGGTLDLRVTFSFPVPERPAPADAPGTRPDGA